MGKISNADGFGAAVKLQFDPSKGYGDAVIGGQDHYHQQLMTVPVINWLHHNVGQLLTQKPQEIAHGDGWQIVVTDWNQIDWQTARTYVIITAPVSSTLVTKFWMKFQ